MIVPLRGYHEGVKSLLGEMMEDDQIDHIVLVTFNKDGTSGVCHFDVTRKEMAWAALLLQNFALEGDDA